MKVLLESYGCTMNRGEAEEFAQGLLSKGHSVVSDEKEADAFAIFTCGVIETTERHMLKRIGQMSKQSGKPIWVCGCLGVINPSAIEEIAPEALIFGPCEHERTLDGIPPGEGEPEDRRESQSKLGMLPISSGCSGNCTYCITRKARGPLTSRRPEQIQDRLKSLISRGCAEIQVCAQDTAIYGEDMGSSLGELLGNLQAAEGDFMIRVGMMNPAGAMRHLDDILEAYEYPKVFKFLHLPLQSGSDNILKAMDRRYAVEDFLHVLSAFRSRFPNLSLSTDIIVGYPGETGEDFAASVEIVKRIEPDIVNITRFSPRPGTPAADMKNQVPGWAAKDRSRIMTDLRFDITKRNYSEMVGQQVKALAVERRVSGTTFLRTVNYKPVVVEDEIALGKWYELEIIGAERTHLIGAWNQNV